MSHKVINGYFRVEEGIYKILSRNIIRKVNTLLLGPTGVGKTELVQALAKANKKKITIFDMGTMSDPIMGLVGTHTIKIEKGKTSSVFTKSRFSQAIQEPGIILLDELSRANVLSNNLLFPCLDFRRELCMEYCFDDCEPIKVHKDCVFFATANIGSHYTGTHKIDRALLDRFMLVEINELDKDEIDKLLLDQHPKMDVSHREKINKVYQEINTSYNEHKISFNMSIRHLKMITALVDDGFTIYDSFLTICKGLGSKEGFQVIKNILDTTDAVTLKGS